MTELQSIKSTIKTETARHPWGALTTIHHPAGLSDASAQIAKDSQTIVALKLYEKNETYRTIYALINTQGETTDILHETAGIMPALFFSPTGELWVSVTPYHPDKELEITIPFRNRAANPDPKPNRPFVGDYAGTTDTCALFHSEDIFSDTKPDKLLRIDFKDGKLKAKKNFKIPLPKGNAPLIQDNQLHLFRYFGINGILHRTLDMDATVLSEQTMPLPDADYSHFKIYKIENDRYYYFAFRENQVCAGNVTPDGKKTEEIIKTGIEMFNLFKPVPLGKNTFLFQFNYETGNGWAVVQNDRIKHLYTGGSDGYKDHITSETVPLRGDLILSGISAPAGDTYSIVFYPNTKPKTEAYVLTKKLNP